jgi:hypothetical protein
LSHLGAVLVRFAILDHLALGLALTHFCMTRVDRIGQG